jgi:hypothetical protein
LLIGVGLDQARIDRKAFATNQTGGNARFDDPLKTTSICVSFQQRSGTMTYIVLRTVTASGRSLRASPPGLS